MLKDEFAPTNARRRSARLVRRVAAPRLSFVPFGLIPALSLFLVLVFGATAFARDGVSDIALRASQQALASTGATWANLSISGQWVTISGAPPSKEDAARAVNAIHEARSVTALGPAYPVTRVVEDFILPGKAPSPPSPAPAALTQPAATPPAASAAIVASCNKTMAELLTLATIEFDTGSATISNASSGLLDSVAKAAANCPAQLRIDGHTDASGSLAKNEGLSRKRADAVRDALVQRGVPAGRLIVEGFGSRKPIATNASEAGRNRNRRIEIHAVASPT